MRIGVMARRCRSINIQALSGEARLGSDRWTLIRSAGPYPVCVHRHVPHHISEFHHRAVRLYRDARRAVDPARRGPLSAADAVLDQDLRGVLRHGVVSGIVLSYQFGTNWSRFSVVAGNVVGPLIGYEVLTAFFLEATFLASCCSDSTACRPAVCDVGGDRGGRTAMSAFWILSANSWMQTPVGMRCAAASLFRWTGSPLCSIQVFPIASRICSTPPI